MRFSDEDPASKATRDPVTPARRSVAALNKAATQETADGDPVHSLHTLLHVLSTRTRNRCRAQPGTGDPVEFSLDTHPTPAQQKAFDRLKVLPALAAS